MVFLNLLVLLPIDSEIPCSKPTRQFMTANNKTTYMWDGATLERTGVNYTTIQFIEHLSNITHLHLLASRVNDATKITTSATKMFLQMAHMANADIVSLDSDLLKRTAAHTVTMMHDTVISTLSRVYPFFAWIYRIIIITLIPVFIALIIFTSLRVHEIDIYKEKRSTY